ncbi:Predicted oxidoreductase, contains short-chain dehydrogenase (SDR) and DUF2520 domains [Dokdonia pacifica]|uniref:Predicted oxidoreductase, contains short-chain dehydrogenase (SDR) and DUF2520 domains n=2 Tax=Dokdonia pacifica TaxID=1627892 RepID=A0A239CWH7_9FLAO|nr:Predicted oxidoreductase, contains short-chain dehydrogenase (SDR) and DUF2520 domains [Dokdonia pacifica]
MTINLIGTGNVAWHLANHLAKIPECTLQQIAGRSPEKREKFKHLAENVVTIDALQPATVTIIAVSDNEIEKVATLVPYQDTLVVHTSGSITIEAISQNRKGVFYPLQSFSKNDTVDFTNIPICIEATTKDDLDILQKLALFLSTKVYHIDSHQRKQAHLAAVFVNNFTNHCYTIAQELCDTHQIPFELLHALVGKTAQKAIDHSPSDVQTGPAKRNDTQVINEHLDMLQQEDHKSIYQTLTASIIAHYGKEL